MSARSTPQSTKAAWGADSQTLPKKAGVKLSSERDSDVVVEDVSSHTRGRRNREDEEAREMSGVMPTDTEKVQDRSSLASKVRKVDDKTYQLGEDSEIIARGCTQKFTAYLIYVEEFLEEKNVPPGFPPAPCLEIEDSSLKRVFEDSKGCRRCGKIGLAFFMFLRKLTLIACISFTTCAFFLRAFPPFAMLPSQGRYRGFVDEYPWAIGTYACVDNSKCNGMDAEMWLGLASFRIESRTHNRYKIVSWSDASCPQELSSLGAAEYCEKCSTASSNCAGLAIASIPFVMVNFYLDFQRLSERTDRNCAKATSLLCNVCGMVLLVAAITAFMNQCVAPFPRIDALGIFQLELRIGNGGYLVVFSIVINFFVIIVHLALPSPPRAWDIDFDFEADRISRTLSVRLRAASRFVKIFGDKFDPKNRLVGQQDDDFASKVGALQRGRQDGESSESDVDDEDALEARRSAIGRSSTESDGGPGFIGKAASDESSQSARKPPAFLKVNAV